MAGGEMVWKVFALGSGVGAGKAAQKAAAAVWRRTRKSDPPENPLSAETTWAEAIAWAAVTGVCLGVARMLVQRGAAEGFKRLSGHYPAGAGPEES